MEGIDATRGCDCTFPDKTEIIEKLGSNEEFLRFVAKVYFKDYIYGTSLRENLGLSLEEFHDILDDNPKISSRFNEVISELASSRIERVVDAGIAGLIDMLSKCGDDVNSLRVIQASIQTLTNIKKTYAKNPVGASKRLSDFERALMELGG